MGPTLPNTILKKNQFRRFKLPDFKTCKAIVSKAVWQAKAQTHRSVEQNEESRNVIYLNGHLIFNKSDKPTQWGNENIFQNGVEITE